MKIVRIIARLNVGGPARHVIWLTEAMRDGEFETVLVAGTVPEGEEDMGYFAADHGVEPVFIPEMSREMSPNDAVSLFKVLRLISREKPDVIHTHTAKAGTVGRLAALLYRWLFWKDVKVVHTFHGHVFHSYYGRLKSSVFLAIERALARLATDRIVVISDQQRDEINRVFGVGRTEQFVVIPLGIDLGSYDPAPGARESFRESIGAVSDEMVVGFVGRLTGIKNLPMLIETAGQYRATIAGAGPNLRFVIVGEGHDRESLENLSRERGTDRIISFVGHRDDPQTFYAGLDIVALCSLNEGTPLSLVEAMACGKPFVSTAVGGVVDLAGPLSSSENGYEIRERGLTTASGDVGGFLNGLLRLASDQNLRDRLSQSGRHFVVSNYSRDRLVADIRGLYRGLSQRNR